MKKIILIVSISLFFASNAFAVNTDTGDGSITIGGGALADGTDSPELTIGLSPKVVAHYISEGTTEETAQWYAIGTVHPGGNLGYGTAQDVNNIYMLWYVTGQGTDTITSEVPAEKNPEPAGPDELAPDWTGNGWSLTTPSGPTAE